MGYENVVTLECDDIIALGGFNKKTGKPNAKSIEGFYIGQTTRLTKGNDEPSQVYVFSTDKGNIGVWGKTHLNKVMTGAKVGLMTLVTQEGTRPTKHQDMYIFKVQQDSSRRTDVSAAISASAEGSFDDTDQVLFEGSEEESVEAYVAPTPPTRPVSTPSAESTAKIRAALAARSGSAPARR